MRGRSVTLNERRARSGAGRDSTLPESLPGAPHIGIVPRDPETGCRTFPQNWGPQHLQSVMPSPAQPVPIRRFSPILGNSRCRNRILFHNEVHFRASRFPQPATASHARCVSRAWNQERERGTKLTRVSGTRSTRMVSCSPAHRTMMTLSRNFRATPSAIQSVGRR